MRTTWNRLGPALCEDDRVCECADERGQRRRGHRHAHLARALRPDLQLQAMHGRRAAWADSADLAPNNACGGVRGADPLDRHGAARLILHRLHGEAEVQLLAEKQSLRGRGERRVTVRQRTPSSAESNTMDSGARGS